MKPEDVLHNWDIPELTTINELSIKPSANGLLNKTFLITSNNANSRQLFVLQRVHPAVSMDGAMNNYFHVTQFLEEQGLITQTVLPMKNGLMWIDDVDGWRWRLLKGVNGKVYNTTKDLGLAEEAGKLLGSMDALLATYPKPLEPGRKSHWYQGIIDTFNQYQEQFALSADLEIREAAALLHTELPKLLLPADLPKSIVHADPKVSNFVFTPEGKGVCMIDFDTVQVLSPLFEVADAVRSWCGGNEEDPNNAFDSGVFHALLRGYLANSKGLLSEREQSLIPQACKLVMLGLTARFMNDYIDDSYFGWDETKYNSRKDHNRARAMGQLSLYKSFIKSI